jgi:hypothetical protein
MENYKFVILNFAVVEDEEEIELGGNEEKLDELARQGSRVISFVRFKSKKKDNQYLALLEHQALEK